MPLSTWFICIFLSFIVYILFLMLFMVLDVVDMLGFQILAIILAIIAFIGIVYLSLNEYEEKNLEEEIIMKNSSLSWNIRNNNELLTIGLLKEDKFLLKDNYYYYINIPSLDELNKNKEMKKQFESYKENFGIHDSLKINLFGHEIKSNGYVIFDKKLNEIYSIKNIIQSLDGDYKIVKETKNKKDRIYPNLKKKDITKISIINYKNIKNDFKIDGFNLIEQDKESEDYDSLTIILKVQKELTDTDYSKILNIFEKYRDYSLNLKIIDENNEKISYHSSKDILKEIDNK